MGQCETRISRAEREREPLCCVLISLPLLCPNSKTLSKAERKAKNITDNSYVYGEVDFHSFATIIREIRPLFPPQGTFVDLGSGTGRPCLAMALLSDMRRIVGIEALEDLVKASEAVREKYELFIEDGEQEEEQQQQESKPQNTEEGEDEEGATKARPTAADGSPLRVRRPPSLSKSPLARLEHNASLSPGEKRLQFVHGDFLQFASPSPSSSSAAASSASDAQAQAQALDFDWSQQADVVFMNSTCYSPALIAAISSRAEKLRSGALVVSLTKAINSPQFTLLSKKKYQMRSALLRPPPSQRHRRASAADAE